MRRPAAPREPGDVVWADSVASLFTAAARRAATSPSVKSMPWSLAPRSALPLPCYTVPWDARSTPYKRMQLLQAAVIASSTPADSNPASNIAQSCWPCPSFPLHISLATKYWRIAGNCSIHPIREATKRARTLGGHSAAIRTGEAESKKRRTSFASGALCTSAAAARLEPSSMFAVVIALRGLCVSSSSAYCTDYSAVRCV